MVSTGTQLGALIGAQKEPLWRDRSWRVAAYFSGCRRETFVRERTGDAAIRDRLQALYADEVLPGVAARGMADAPAYVAATLERLPTPSLTIACPTLPRTMTKRSATGSVPSCSGRARTARNCAP